LAARIPQPLHTVLATDDVNQEAAAEAEAKQIFLKHGLPTIADVGDEAAYEFVVLMCSRRPADFQAKILLKAKEAVSRHALAPDAVLYCEARVRQEQVKARVKRRPPTHPALRDEIQRLLTTDQAVRQTKDFDASKMEQIDREHEAAMVYDRSSREGGRKQLYGENLECNEENPTLHETPIEDEEHVNVRRARVGLMRVELYARTVTELSPSVCPAAATMK